jgi:hypothetical protein
VARDNLNEKKVKVDLLDFLDELEDLNDRTTSKIKDWNKLLKSLCNWLAHSELGNIVDKYEKEKTVYDDDEKETLNKYYDDLCLLSDERITCRDQIETIYSDLKSTLNRIISFLPHTFFRSTKWDGFPFLACFGFLLVLLSPDNSVIIAYVVAVIGLVITYFCKFFEEKTKKERIVGRIDEAERKESDEQNQEFRKKITAKRESLKRTRGVNNIIIKSKGAQFRIFAAVFGLIAALAITAPIESVLNTDCQPTVNQSCINSIEDPEDWLTFLSSQQVVLIASFFAIGILFYHCCILVLSNEIATLIEEGSKITAFVSSLIIFLQGIALFAAASSTDNLVRFSLWFVVLLLLDIVWLIINLRTRIDTTFQWLHMDLIVFLFLIIVLVSSQQNTIVSNMASFNHWTVLFVFLMRATIDYNLTWKYFTKIPTND